MERIAAQEGQRADTESKRADDERRRADIERERADEERKKRIEFEDVIEMGRKKHLEMHEMVRSMKEQLERLQSGE